MTLSQLKVLVNTYRTMSGECRDRFKDQAKHALMLYKESIAYVERKNTFNRTDD